MLKLLGNSSFSGVTLAQFFAALNDNAMRQAFLLIAVETAARELQASASALFALPFVLFSPLAGQIADRFSKRTVIMITKLIEIVVVLLAGYALWIDDLSLLLIALLLMATQSAFFSPAKYSILPEILPYESLSKGNGIIQMTTYVAILLGSAIAGFLLQFFPVIWTAGTLITMGVVGFLPTLLIEPLPAADPKTSLDWNAFRTVAENLLWIRKDRLLLTSMIGFAFFFFLGTLLTLNLNVYGLKTMDVGEAYTSLLMIFLALGIGAGSLLAGQLSGDKIELGLVLLGVIGLIPSLFLFWYPIDSLKVAYTGMFFVGISGGLFLIPLQTILQERPPEDDVGDALGTTNILTFVGVLVASAVYVVLIGWFDVRAPLLMFMLALATLLIGITMIMALPQLLIRSTGWILRQFYRVEIEGKDKLPNIGPGILIVDQEQPVDGILFNGIFSRFLRYIHSANVRNLPVFGFLLTPINPGDWNNKSRTSGGWYHEDEFLYWAPNNVEKSIREDRKSWISLKNHAVNQDLPLIFITIRHGNRRLLTVDVDEPHEPNSDGSLPK